MTAPARSPQGASVSDCDLVLTVLQAAHGDWVPDLYRLHVMVHSRVAELRRRGYLIECRRFGVKDYRYRLVAGQDLGGDQPEEPRHYDERGMVGA